MYKAVRDTVLVLVALYAILWVLGALGPSCAAQAGAVPDVCAITAY